MHDFLVSRRARITPAQAGMPTYGEKRRVPGLRREEVASLAGVSFDYYARLERGNLAGVSDSVLEALARALQLDEAERQHLFDLAKAASVPASRSGPAKSQMTRVRPAVLSILDGMTGTPAYVRNARLDILAANDLCLALYDGVFVRDDLPFNLARFVFLDPIATQLHPNWDASARTTVALLRTEAGRNPYDKGLTDLVGELSTRSDDFRMWWAAHDVRLHYAGTKHFHHPAVGDLVLAYDALDLPADPGLTLTVYSAEPGTAAADGLTLLASWAAVNQQTDQPQLDGADTWPTHEEV